MSAQLTETRGAGAAPLDLDARIREAELRVIENDENARRHLEAIGHRLTHMRRPRQMVLPAVAVAAGVLGFAWLLRRVSGRGGPRRIHLRHGAPPPSHAGPYARPYAYAAAPPAAAGFSWAHLLGLALPLIARRSPAHGGGTAPGPLTASAVLALGLPLMQSWLARREAQRQPAWYDGARAADGHAALWPDEPAGAQPVESVGYIDLSRYAGTWYELARLPAPFEAVCSGQPTATYTPGVGGIEVVNRCRTLGSHVTESRGIAQVVPGSGGSKLKVSLFPAWLRWLPMAWADYWVLAIDDGYRCALVGDPKRRFLWVLSRTPRLARGDFETLLSIAERQGFDLRRLKVNTPG